MEPKGMAQVPSGLKSCVCVHWATANTVNGGGVSLEAQIPQWMCMHPAHIQTPTQQTFTLTQPSGEQFSWPNVSAYIRVGEIALWAPTGAWVPGSCVHQRCQCLKLQLYLPLCCPRFIDFLDSILHGLFIIHFTSLRSFFMHMCKLTTPVTAPAILKAFWSQASSLQHYDSLGKPFLLSSLLQVHNSPASPAVQAHRWVGKKPVCAWCHLLTMLTCFPACSHSSLLAPSLWPVYFPCWEDNGL